MPFKSTESVDWTTLLFGGAVFIISVVFFQPPLHFSVFLGLFMISYVIEKIIKFKGIALLFVGIYPAYLSAMSLWQDGVTMLNLALLIVGLLVIAAAIYTLEPQQDLEPESDGSEAYIQMIVLRRVHDELQDGPKTVDELSTALNHTEQRIEKAVKYLHARNMVDERSGKFRLSPSARTFTGRLRLNLKVIISKKLSRW